LFSFIDVLTYRFIYEEKPNLSGLILRTQMQWFAERM